MNNLSEEELRSCVHTANSLLEDYNLFVRVPAARKSVDDLRTVLPEFGSGTSIKFEEIGVNDESYAVRGVTLTYTEGDGKTTFRVGILPDGDENMRRIVLTKEMFQVIFDKDACRNMGLYEHLAAMYADSGTEAAKRESMAEIAAMHFLYPYADRVNDLKLLASGKLTPEEIVNYYGVPQYYVELYLTQAYMDKLRSSALFSVVGAATGSNG